MNEYISIIRKRNADLAAENMILRKQVKLLELWLAVTAAILMAFICSLVAF